MKKISSHPEVVAHLNTLAWANLNHYGDDYDDDDEDDANGDDYGDDFGDDDDNDDDDDDDSIAKQWR